MTIKELIIHLEEQLKITGDIPVMIVINGEYSDIIGSCTS